MTSYQNILEQNIYDPMLKDKFLIIGSCLPNIHPEIVKKFVDKWENAFSICLEQSHYNQLHAKLSSILGTGNTSKVGFLTVDGSPHCVQVHFVSKYLARELKNRIAFEHYVINKEGKVFEVTMEAIDESRNLAKTGKQVKL